ncbi:SMP-30/gluconolactonase/LRE family protein [Lentzea sp. NPDC051213]|uniref:SMP-30/gluconolactonase/LRE family protein n=1 Tax=Lentzea sp. NPDC051213 TaxID=3364126 RepID=UPI003794A735
MRTTTVLRRVLAAPLLIMTLVTAGAAPASAARSQVIVLPGAVSAEGIAVGRGSTFFAGDLIRGDIFRGDLRRGKAEMFVDNPDGRMAVGMAVLASHNLLFVAGGGTGQAYVYDTETGATLATYQFGAPSTSVINDVAVTSRGAWFTDSVQAKLYFVPVGPAGALGEFRTLTVTGPAAVTPHSFNLNGIQAAPGGRSLVVAHSGTGSVYTVDAVTGASALIAGVSVPGVDGLVLSGRSLWAVQASNQISLIRLSPGLDSGAVQKVITSDLLQSPATAALHGDRLAVINGKFDTGFPPTADRYEAVVLPAR